MSPNAQTEKFVVGSVGAFLPPSQSQKSRASLGGTPSPCRNHTSFLCKPSACHITNPIPVLMLCCIQVGHVDWLNPLADGRVAYGVLHSSWQDGPLRCLDWRLGEESLGRGKVAHVTESNLGENEGVPELSRSPEVPAPEPHQSRLAHGTCLGAAAWEHSARFKFRNYS